MSVIQIILQVLVAALAVIGAYAILRVATISAIASRQVTSAVVLREAVDEVTLDILLDEAMRAPGRRRGQRVALVIARPLLAGPMGKDNTLAPDYAAVAERYRAEILVADL